MILKEWFSSNPVTMPHWKLTVGMYLMALIGLIQGVIITLLIK